MKISSKSGVLHYIFIYIMLLCNQSVAQQQLSVFVSYGVLCLTLVLFIWLGSIEKRTCIFLAFLLGMTILLYFITKGGIGPSHWINWATMILITLVVVYWDRECVIERYLRVVYILSLISIIFFIWQIGDIDSLRKIFLIHGELAQSYEVYSYFESAITTSLAHYPFDGMFIYVVNGMNEIRNVGLYTEPGVFQMVINTAIFFLLFEGHAYTGIKKKKYLVIYVITLLTSQSTTGYIVCAVIILVYLWVSDKKIVEKSTKTLVLKLLLCLAVVCIVDVLVNGSESLLYRIVINKISSASGEVTGNFMIATTSGGARLGTAILAIKTMIFEPWGVGYSKMSALMDTSTTGFVGAEFLVMGAAMGVIPFIIISWWIYSPIISNKKLNIKVKIVLIFMFLNSLLAQSAVFYPALIMIPIYYYSMRYRTYEK